MSTCPVCLQDAVTVHTNVRITWMAIYKVTDPRLGCSDRMFRAMYFNHAFNDVPPPLSTTRGVLQDVFFWKTDVQAKATTLFRMNEGASCFVILDLLKSVDQNRTG